jgi:RNA recognition motif-containing protein
MTDTENDEIFISGLPLDVTEEELATYFGQIDIIKEVSACKALFYFFFNMTVTPSTTLLFPRLVCRIKSVAGNLKSGYIETKRQENSRGKPR